MDRAKALGDKQIAIEKMGEARDMFVTSKNEITNSLIAAGKKPSDLDVGKLKTNVKVIEEQTRIYEHHKAEVKRLNKEELGLEEKDGIWFD